MNRLPHDIIRENIIPYTYNRQPIELCNDIKSFFNIREHLLKFYYDRWNHAFYYEKNAQINWLENDIIRFYNNDIALMSGIHIDYTDKYKRLFILHNKNTEYINNVITLNLNMNPKNMINCLLAILTCEERIDLVNFCKKLDLVPLF